ncbi:glycerol kinase GlpK [Peptostreptococcus canis]|uniref:Glycerol kinase n=1 Tax=Peptostreptococcus canis TaxID=1159213 RepID=A0ABR6TK32_9FIRM|nr:glycerol kinase GlpK [Peptostreptococcus canis]MBC2575775.1 glycerol kinase GlpK [Peptostreptococcus canis]MBP1998110.1 glycerol kinase [Peptostreptococcus canis]
MEQKYIMSLDAGTTSCRAILFQKNGNIVKISQKEFAQYYPEDGWVEHDALEIWGTMMGVVREVIEMTGISPNDISCIGITNQRETTVVWDKNTGKPVYNAIVWQCRRTADYCDKIEKAGYSEIIKKKTGLKIDAYFSATKIRWILDNIEGTKEKATNGDLIFGTIDTWLIWNLTRGKYHVTDYTNASRTMLFNIEKLEWDEDLLELFEIPKSMLPKVKQSSCIFGKTDKGMLAGAQIPISGCAGDQQASLFGQICLNAGDIKNTYGTGCFVMMNTGEKLIQSKHGLLTTIAWGINGKVEYALEGSIFIGGSLIQWIRDEMKLIDSSEESEYFATRVEDNNGVYIVPAFTGLGAPYWDMYARGTIVGLTRNSNKSHIIRACLEAIAYQSKDVILAMQEDACVDIKKMKVDGGASNNNFLMQFQSNILGIEVIKSKLSESTALGVAYLAGLGVGIYSNIDEIKSMESREKVFIPTNEKEKYDAYYYTWLEAVRRSFDWIKGK